MKWVKASEWLPDKKGYYNCKLQSAPLVFWIDKKNYSIVNNVGSIVPVEIWYEITWLDETESPAPDGWVRVEDGLPKPEQNVIVSFLSGDKRRTAIAFYTPKHHTEYDGDNEDFGDYSEENGGITYCPEGWYEFTWEHDENYMIKNVTHWQPLPHPPKKN